MSVDKSGSPPCGIYVRIDQRAYHTMPKTMTALRQMAMTINRASGYEQNMAVVELGFHPQFEEEMFTLIKQTQAEGLVAIISGVFAGNLDLFDLEIADGVLCNDLQDLSLIKNKLSAQGIIGVHCGHSKESINDAISQDIDFIKIAADPNLIQWASAQTQALIVASGQGITNDHCGFLARSGAGFVDVGEYIFGHAKGVMQASVNVLHALELAAEEKSGYSC